MAVSIWQRINRKRTVAGSMEKAARLSNMRATGERKLDRQTFIDCGRAYNIPPENIAALCAVESNGYSYDSDGRLKILFEPHVFHRATQGAYNGLKMPVRFNGEIVQAEVSYRRWRRMTTEQSRDPGFFHIYKLSNLDRWDLLIRLYEMDERALEAASFGSFQIVGNNWRQLGYSSALGMVEDLYTGELANIAAAMRFCRMAQIDTALRNGDWLRFARRYNGPAAASTYARRLEAAARRKRLGMGL